VIKRGGVDYITLTDGQIQFNQPTNISVDDTNYVKKTGEVHHRIDGTMSFGGDKISTYAYSFHGASIFNSDAVLNTGRRLFATADLNRYIYMD
jgi:hypothetical protein